MNELLEDATLFEFGIYTVIYWKNIESTLKEVFKTKILSDMFFKFFRNSKHT